jgi:hypothetical protein
MPFSSGSFSNQNDVADVDFNPQFLLPFIDDGLLQGDILVHPATGQGKNLFSTIDVLHAQDFTGLFKNGRHTNSHEKPPCESE